MGHSSKMRLKTPAILNMKTKSTENLRPPITIVSLEEVRPNALVATPMVYTGPSGKMASQRNVYVFGGTLNFSVMNFEGRAKKSND